MQRIEHIRTAAATPPARQRRHGSASQGPGRRAERIARRGAVAFSRWARRRGLSRSRIAAMLGRPIRTLSRWCRQWSTGRLTPRARGRPARCADVGRRNEVIATLGALGPGTGTPTCQGLFPDLSRRQVEDLVRRFKRADRRRRRRNLAHLQWRRPGMVWAMDHSYPPQVIEGRHRRIFALRDLASGCQLAFDPVPDESADYVVGTLVTLFILFGPPLLIKADNGSPFIGSAVRELLKQWGVFLLLSPVRRPQYNGSVEAANGSMKLRVEELAARADRPGVWTCRDTIIARVRANCLLRPKGPQGPTPHQLWQCRRPITDQQRRRFAAAVDYFRRRLAGATPATSNDQRRSPQGALERRAIVSALSACGLLHIRRRRFTPPVAP